MQTIGILGQVWCLILSIPDLCPLSYFTYSGNIFSEIERTATLKKDHELVFKTYFCLMQIKSIAAILSTFIKLPFVIKIF